MPLEASWQALDIATGAGHTAFALAPHVAQVTATDITPEMLELTREGAIERNLGNVLVETAAAEDLEYPAGQLRLHNLSDCRPSL